MVGSTPAFAPSLVPVYPSVAGLRVFINPGVVWLAGTSFLQPGGFMSVAPFVTTFIFINTTTGAMQSTTTGFPTAGVYPVCTALANSHEIITLADQRPDVFGGGSGGGGGGGNNFSINETPSGTINGSNSSFSLANLPLSLTSALYYNGLRLQLGNDYTLTGNIISMSNPPQPGDILIADYQYA